MGYIRRLLKSSFDADNSTKKPSELAVVVSFRDDYIKWRRIEVSWWVTAD